jgi:small subunit ribosomal protein S6
MLYEMIGVVSSSPQSHSQRAILTPLGPTRPPLRSKRVRSLPTLISHPIPCLTPYRIAKTAGTIILSQRGVVRGYTNWGTFLLPKPAKKLQSTHHYGHHFIMRFDASAKAQHALRRTMSLDPRLIRYSVVKMGEKFEDIVEVGGKAEFR